MTKRKEGAKRNIDPEDLVKWIEKIQEEDEKTLFLFHKKKYLLRLKSKCLKHATGVIASLKKHERSKSEISNEIPFEKIRPLLPESLQTEQFSNLLRSFGSVKFFGDLTHATRASKRIKEAREREEG